MPAVPPLNSADSSSMCAEDDIMTKTYGKPPTLDWPDAAPMGLCRL
jgi:hypothetical protein